MISKPIINKMKQLAVTGIYAQTRSGVKHVKAFLLAGVFDLPAKAAVLNTVHFNGKFGCTYCKDQGLNIRTGQHIYPPHDSHSLRTSRR